MENTTQHLEIIYGVCSWGLGHATRSLPVIRKLIKEQHTVTVISHGRSLEVLKKELGEEVTYVDIPDYPMLLSETTRQFLAKSMVYWPVFIKRIEDGLAQLQKILQKKPYDCIMAGERGGRVIVQGTPEQIARSRRSHTARYLRSRLARRA